MSLVGNRKFNNFAAQMTTHDNAQIPEEASRVTLVSPTYPYHSTDVPPNGTGEDLVPSIEKMPLIREPWRRAYSDD